MGINLLNQEKRANAAKILSDSYTAAMSAYKALAGIPLIGPALGAAAAGTILAAGVSYSAKSLQGRALGGQVRDGESYIVGERGPEVLTMGSSRGFITPNDQLRQQTVNNAGNVANVTFNITANDTTGFDELLNKRRGQIIGMVNQALNNSGRSNLV
jgi:SLT domain-containing protein